ncbi:MAG: type II toxin-antitoxin system VapC family toxin [Ardenticatenia bacterium]|nr:type II toxin-antitoxin system VapC family toxin [Ardenticatenia bacterium]
MRAMFLVDTNILSQPVRPIPDPEVIRHLQQHDGRIATATLVWHELLFGCYRLPPSARRTMIERYLHDVVSPAVPLLDYDARAAQWHAAERARLAAAGITPPFVDGQIAAVAAVNGLVLATLNHADFQCFEGLKLADWG